MKKIIYPFAIALLAAVPSCSDDKDSPETQSLSTRYEGTLVTTIPDVADFGAVTVDNWVEIDRHESNTSIADITVGAFSIEVAMMGRGIDIGEMRFADVSLNKTSDGTETFNIEDFTVQAGAYSVTGSIDGIVSADGSKADISINYRPGSMPFSIKSVFTGSK